jgi:hypothetical protein
MENRESNAESRKVAFRRAKVSNLFGGAVRGKAVASCLCVHPEIADLDHMSPRLAPEF